MRFTNFYVIIKAMNTIIIPKNFAKQDDLVVVLRKEYEALLELRQIREFVPTAAQKKALLRARKNRKEGRYLTINEIRKRLGFTS